MNQTIDCFGADNIIIQERPLTISYIDEDSPQKFINISQLLASKNKKKTQKQSERSQYQVTLRDYYYQTYVPARSPPNLQIQFQNYQQNTSRSTNSRINNFRRQKEIKCKTLPLNEINIDEIQKRIELKKLMLEKMYLYKDNYKTQLCNTEKQVECGQTQKQKTDLLIQSNKISQKKQEIQNPKLTQSRIGFSCQNNRKINIFQVLPLTLGLSIGKCKIKERVNQSPLQNKKSEKKSLKKSKIIDRCQKIMIQKPRIQQESLKKKCSIPIAKWDHSDLEFD
ncbi:unnamed protein product [Paramecium sonneborni]|uniref:Uncharacterized protein n=1 Tax=Paramecium sonneborni TaxID=65129 RepID=A0A8S1MCZ6_9CILI|nr:unnamed protein product [Paramecium sonneborni]